MIFMETMLHGSHFFPLHELTTCLVTEGTFCFTGPRSPAGSALAPLGERPDSVEAHGAFWREGMWVV